MTYPLSFDVRALVHADMPEDQEVNDRPMRVGGGVQQASQPLSTKLAERCQWLKRKTEFHFRGLTPDERCDLRGLTLELREMADDAYELEHQPLHLLELKGTRDAGA